MKRFWIFFILVVAGLVTAFILTSKPNEVVGDPTALQADDHQLTASDQKVIFIEYGDFQCPGCGAAFPILKELKTIYKDQVTFVFRHLPLTGIHPNALAAARAAEAAGKQSKFFEMHDLLYENQNSWQGLQIGQAQVVFEGYAQQLALNQDQFKSEYASAAVADRINRDVDAAASLNITATPSFLLNGQKIETPTTQAAYETVLNDAIKAAGGTPPSEASEAQ